MNTEDSFQNTLYYGDNLTIMQKYIKDESIDLIYLDPPFNSNRNYNILYKNLTGHDVPEQVEAFCDTWELDAQKEELARQMPLILREKGYDEIFARFWEHFINALRNTQSKLLAYLVYMTIRLIEMKRILKPSGSIYFHCDPTASHYIKIVLDGIFGHKNFRNEIVWCYGGRGMSKRWFNKKHDIILFYSKQSKYFFNDKKSRRPINEKDIKRYNKMDEEGKKYARVKNKNGSYSNIYLKKEGVVYEDYWTIPFVRGNEYIGYPTQKPIQLLNRIVQASCPEYGIVFDPFCGCGTTIAAAHLNNRKWVGCDIAILSINLIETKVLKERYALKEGSSYKIDGIPLTVEQAQKLFETDSFQFEHWCIETVGGFCNSKQVGDKGVDGYIYFRESEKEGFKRMILSVKGGKHLNPGMVRDLRGVLDRDAVEMAGFICLKEPAKKMREEASSAGQIEILGKKYNRLQMITVEKMLEYKKENKDIFSTPTLINNQGESQQVRLKF